MVARWANRLLFCFNLVLGCLLIYLVSFRAIVSPTDGWSRGDLVTILLASITVELTGLAIFLGVLAVWGYSTLREHAAREATERAIAVAREEAGIVATRAIQAAMVQFTAAKATPDLPDALSRDE